MQASLLKKRSEVDMIIVIADDITGAAELGGVALRYGLRAIVSDDVHVGGQCDILIIYTNTRSMKKEQAVAVMEELTAKALRLDPSLFYKKTDSVLRGHIVAEMKAQMKVMNVNKALLVPVNPSLGRIIRDGHYYVNGELIGATAFSTDPEFPATGVDVVRMLGEEQPVTIVPKNGPLPATGISLGEAETNEEVAAWAKHNDPSVLMAGGAALFDALLATALPFKNKTAGHAHLSSPSVLVSGTAFSKNVERIRSCAHLVSYIPAAIFTGSAVRPDYQKWLDEILHRLSTYNTVIIAADNSADRKAAPLRLRDEQAEMVRLIFEAWPIKELMIEGGSTAYSIVKKMLWRSFVPTHELQQGIVRMEVQGIDDLHLTIKPGSYEWPAEWNFN